MKMAETVNGRTISFFYQEENGEVIFAVDEDCYHIGLPPNEGASIIRAALRLWPKFLSEIPTDKVLVCHPSVDNFYERRLAVYTSLGFCFINERDQKLKKMTLLPTNRLERFVRTSVKRSRSRKRACYILLANQMNY